MKRKSIGVAAFTALVLMGATLGNPHWNLVTLPSGRNVAYDYSLEVHPGIPLKVLHAIDGDTIEFANGERLRYIGIDTPESVDARKPVQCFAHEASKKNKELVEGKMVTFQKDVSEKDLYGRWLGYVTLEDGTFVNEELVKQGYAFSYSFPPDISKQTIFRNAENLARKEKRGLWSGCRVNTLGSGRKQTNSAEKSH